MLGRGFRQLLSWLSFYLPVLVLVCMTLGSYWMLRQEPKVAKPESKKAESTAPTYFMQNAVVRAFSPVGALQALVSGSHIQHVASTGIYEIQDLVINETGQSNRSVSARANQARANADFSEWQLQGQVQLTLNDENPEPTQLKAEFVQIFVPEERIVSPLPIQIDRGASQLRAQRFSYDRLLHRWDLEGQVHIQLEPSSAASETP